MSLRPFQSSNSPKGTTASRLLFPAESPTAATNEDDPATESALSVDVGDTTETSTPMITPGTGGGGRRSSVASPSIMTPSAVKSPAPSTRGSGLAASPAPSSSKAMHGAKESRQFNAASRPDRLESILRSEEAKLMDLISRVAVSSSDIEDPFAALGGEEAFKHTRGGNSPMSRKEVRRSMIRSSMSAPPLIGSDHIESSYNRTVIESMQAMVAQSVEDMKAMQADKDKEIKRLNHKVKHLENEIENLRDQLCIVAHYSNLFTSSTRAAMNDGNFTVSGTKKMFLEKLGDTLTTLLDKFGFINEGNGAVFASSSSSSPSSSAAPEAARSQNQRRQSLNAIPFQRVMASKTYQEGFEEANENPFGADDDVEEPGALSPARHRSQSIVPFSSPSATSRPRNKTHEESDPVPSFTDLVSLPVETDVLVEEIFIAFCGYSHSRDKKSNPRAINNDATVPLERVQMSKKNFLAMCLILDIIDSKLTMQIAKACFEKHAFECDRGKAKFNSRLTINAFVECLARMASFKYPSSSSAKQTKTTKQQQTSSLASSLSTAVNAIEGIGRLIRGSTWDSFKEHPMKQKLIDIFLDFCHPSIFDAFSKFQELLYRAYQRSVNYNVEGRAVVPTATASKSAPATPAKESISEDAAQTSTEQNNTAVVNSPSARYLIALRGSHQIVPNFDRKAKNATESSTAQADYDFEAHFINSSVSDADIKICTGFKVFCAEYKIVPTLTRESVAVRIAMHMSMLTSDGFRYFMGCMFSLCIALTKTEGLETAGDLFESVQYSANLLAVLDMLDVLSLINLEHKATSWRHR